jgi:hypothetical protein
MVHYTNGSLNRANIKNKIKTTIKDILLFFKFRGHMVLYSISISSMFFKDSISPYP